MIGATLTPAPVRRAAPDAPLPLRYFIERMIRESADPLNPITAAIRIKALREVLNLLEAGAR